MVSVRRPIDTGGARRAGVRTSLAVAVTAGATLAGVALAAPANAAPASATSHVPSRAVARTAAASNSIDQTPQMGFNDWNAFGCNVSAKLIRQTAQYLVTSGLRDDGYDYVDIDDCWMTSQRSDSGDLVPDPAKFPNGIKPVANYVHARGLKLGIYESAGATTCQGYPGSLGHEQTDADDFAKWGVDLLKYDNCGTTTDDSSTKAEYKARYKAMATALANSGRDIAYSVCEWGNFEPWKWAKNLGAVQWRTTGDISDTYSSMLSNFEQNVVLSKYARPGHFNDPDMLEIGNGGMTDTEYRSEFSLWSEMAAPLVVGSDLRTASASTLAILGNKDVIAVDQDSLAEQGVLLSDTGGKYVLAKPLSNGDVSVALFNSTDSATHIGTTAKAASVPNASVYRIKDLWSKQVTESAGRIDAYVGAHATVMYRVHPITSSSAATTARQTLRPHTAMWVTTGATSVASNGSTTAAAHFINDGARGVYLRTMSMTAPSGWTLTSTSSVKGTAVPSGQKVAATYDVDAPTAGKPMVDRNLAAMASYKDLDGRTSSDASATVTLYNPVSSPLETADTTGAGALFGEKGADLAVRAAGTGVNPASTGFITRDASDEYGAIYSPGAVSDGSTVQATVTAHNDAAGFTSNSSTGIMIRNDATASGDSPEGVTLYLNGRGNVAMAWAANGGTTVDTTAGGGGPGAAAPALPVMLRLVRSGDTYTGSYSTDGSTWTTVGTATLPDAGAASSQDAAVFHTSGSTSATEADFTDFSVTTAV